jgi:3-oxoacyl-[acyl-carrier protein] reductase
MESEMNEQTNKVAIVTGASRGIGAAIATRLAKDGFTVVVNYASGAAAADALVAKIGAEGGHASAAQADVSKPDEVRRMFDSVETAFGGVDVLVNNAGIMPVGAVAEMSDEAFNKLIDINLKGSFSTLREAARRMRGGGRVVNFSSSVTGLRQPTFAAYAATKAAIEVITPILAKELTGRNITVNAVAPGPVATELMLSHSTPETIERLVSMTPLRRLGQPEDIASAVAFLVGPDAGWVNGQTIRVNGGII